MTAFAELPLLGPSGEPVDLQRTLLSHGVASLPPALIDEAALTLTVTLDAPGGARTVRVGPTATTAGRGRDCRPAAAPDGALLETVDAGAAPEPAAASALTATLRRMLCLDDDLSAFYARAARDPALAWACAGAGRMLRAPSVFEDVVKTVCTTNCAWSATERMVGALVRELGSPAPGAPQAGVAGRAFPTPAAMAAADEGVYRDVARAGYRGPRLRSLAASVAGGELDLEELYAAPAQELPDAEVEQRLLALPGVGPYAAAHVMMLLGRHSRLVLDSWTRPKYARLRGKRPGSLVPDDAIRRRFRPYGPYAGLAFWLFLTRDWVSEAGEAQGW
jgi:3-methyladenine DNA glycosylase/8-oxoguanine DNA glycosylase